MTTTNEQFNNMGAPDIQANLKISREFLALAIKWGKHVVMPFNPLAMRDIFMAYEAQLMIQEQAAAEAAKATAEAHQRYIAELTGKIGGMQKRINALEAAAKR